MQADRGERNPRTRSRRNQMTTTLKHDAATTRTDWKEFILPAAMPYYKDPLILVEASGSTVTDDGTGRRIVRELRQTLEALEQPR